HSLSRRGPLSPGFLGRRGRGHGRASAGSPAAELHPLLRGRLEGALLRGPPRDEAGRQRRGRGAVVLERDGGGSGAETRGQAAGGVGRPALEGGRVRGGAVAI